MAITSARTPEEYVAEQPPERREALSTLRDVICRNLPAGYEEGIEFGMIIRGLADVPIDVVGQAIARTPLDRSVAKYESMRGR